jgi:hypothetical protein
MQIHEVFGLDVGAGANTRAAQRRQGKYAASAAKSADKLRQQGYGQPTTPLTVNQLISQVQNDTAAQQLINTWAAQWPRLATNVPAAPPAVPTSAPAAPPAATQPVTIYGQRLDPNDPADARIIAQLRSRGIVNEQQASPDPNAYRAAFVSWADQTVERTIRQSGVIDQIKKDSDWAQKFKQAEDAVLASINNAQRNAQAVQAYLTLAVAAARAYQQDRPNSRFTRGGPTGLNDPRADALAQTLGIDTTDIAKLNAFLRRQGETINPQGTGSSSLDALLRAAKLLR